MTLGIDFGLTHVRAAVMVNGQPQLLTFAEAEQAIPAVAMIDPTGRIVTGAAAIQRGSQQPQRLLPAIRRLLGHPPAEIDAGMRSAAEAGGYAIVQQDGQAAIEIEDRRYTGIEICSQICQEVRQQAEAALEGAIGRVVITVPPHFHDVQRLATRQTAEAAGLTVARLANEPTAAMLGYQIAEEPGKIVAVFALGHSFEFTLVQYEEGIWQILSVGGDLQVGGEKLTDLLASQLLSSTQLDLAQLSPADAWTLRWACRQARRELETRNSTELELRLANRSLRQTLTRDEFERIIAPTVMGLRDPIMRVLADVGLSVADIDEVLLVGDEVQIPLVQDFSQTIFERPPSVPQQPEAVVALGAARLAHQLEQSGAPESDPDLQRMQSAKLESTGCAGVLALVAALAWLASRV